MPYTRLRKGRFSQTGVAYHITTVTLHRTPHFSDINKGRKVVQELKALQEQGKAETLCYVLMPDHLHWLMVLQGGELSEVMRLLKGRSARTIGQGPSQLLRPCRAAGRGFTQDGTLYGGQPIAR